jgi:hypothetical protein
LESPVWLSEETVNAALKVLARQFPHIAGFSNTLNCGYVGGLKNNMSLADVQMLRDAEVMIEGDKDRPARQVQIIFVGHNHWATVSNIRSSQDGEVSAYDSYQQNWSIDFKHQVASAFRFKNLEEFTIVWPPIGQQPNGNDCALYAIAFCVALAFDIDPVILTFDVAVKNINYMEAI